MAISSRYRHMLVIRRNTATGATDGYGQPVMSASTVTTVPGLVQPRRAREVESASQGGAVVGDHVGYLDPLAGLTTHDWVEVDGIRYDILAIYDAGGVGHHLELGLRRIG
jgi:hypothetical protein